MAAGDSVPTISVLIVSYNTRERLRRCLETVVSTFDDVVVVDNASSDGTDAMVAQRFPSVTLVHQSTNLGFAAGVNVAATRAVGNVLFILNPDTELTCGREVFEAALARHKSAAVLGFRQLDTNGCVQLGMGPRPSLRWELLRKCIQEGLDRSVRAVGTMVDRVFARACDVPWVTGASMLVRRKAFEEVGGFDEGFFLYFEDADFCLRVACAGGRVVYEPAITVVHHRGSSASQDPHRVGQAYRESRARYVTKHRGARAAQTLEWMQGARQWIDARRVEALKLFRGRVSDDFA